MSEQLSIGDQLRANPDNYAYLSGVLLGVLANMRSYVDATSQHGKRITAKEIRRHLDYAAELIAIRDQAWRDRHEIR